MTRKLLFLCFMMFVSASVDLGAQTNDFYDDAPTNQLGVPKIEVVGELENPGIINLEKLPLRSVICKEAEFSGDKDKFIGAYRYDGYSLYDILNSFILKKKNGVEFPPIIDLYVIVTNRNGEKAVLSWGEIYYPIHRHEIIIATAVARIVPSKTKELWPLPVSPKLVVSSDLITSRNISNPEKIEVVSFSGTYTINKGMSPMISQNIKVKNNDQLVATINELPENLAIESYPSVFYGRGMGIHGISQFKGAMLKDLLQKDYKLSNELIREGLFVFAGLDGYRCVYSYSEIFNRSDQDNVLIIDEGPLDGGRYRLFPSADFFSDRAIKSLMEIKLVHPAGK